MTNAVDEKPSSTQVLLCAYAIAELTTALEHLDALETVGIMLPIGMRSRIETEQQHYCRLWWTNTHGDPTYRHDNTPVCVTEARAWVTERVAELDDLIESRRNQENA